MKVNVAYLFCAQLFLMLVYAPLINGQEELFDFSNYDHFLQENVETGKIAGAVSLVSYKGTVVHNEAIGYNNLGDKTPMTSDKIFYLQSMTKPIVSVAFMTLYEQGLFTLSDPVSKYIPAFDSLKVIEVQYDAAGNMTGVEHVPLKRPILIWHLLSHTAGFSHGLGTNEYEANLYKALYPEMEGNPTHEDIEGRVNVLLSYPLMGHPGEQWNYSASPDVLALLIEKLSGKTAAEYLKEVIFTPLGMTSTGYNVSDDDLDRIVGLHRHDDTGTLVASPQWSPLQGNKIYGGTHGLFSTASDYLKFGEMLVNGRAYNGHRILSRKTLELMTKNFIEGLPYQPGQGFGLGFGVRTDLADSHLPGSVGNFYWSGLFCTYFFVDPVEDLVAVLMTQSWPYSNYYGDMLRQFVYSSMKD